jgi:hypothetical protein
MPNGTYKCMAVRIWDNVTYSPDATTTSGACAAATDYTMDLCGGGTGGEALHSYWNPPTSDNLTKGVTLGAALVISAAKTSTFKTTLTNRIADLTLMNNTSCQMLKPAFTFE